MNTPLVSVIIPNYNSSETILECINSVLSQTYTNIEIIVVDDGSTDGSVKLISDFMVDKQERIKLILQMNSGPSVARNKAILHAQGKYVAFLDSDDSWYQHKIEKQVNLFSMNPSLVFAGTLYSIGVNQIFPKSSSKIQIISLSQLVFKNFFITSTVMCSREVLQSYNFNVKQKYSEDYRLWLQLAAINGSLCILQNEILTKMSDKPLWGAKGLSSKLWLMQKGELSNFYFMYKNSHISLPLFLNSSIYSMLKYVRRSLLCKLK